MEAHFKACKAYGKAGEKVAGTKEAVVEVAKKHKVSSYTDRNHSPPLTLSLVEGKLKVKVRELGRDSDDDGEDEEQEAA